MKIKTKKISVKVLSVFLVLAILATYSITAFGATPSYVTQEVQRVSAKVNSLQNEDTFTIMGLSDPHYNAAPNNPEAVNTAGIAANALCDSTDIDMMAILGDYICGSETSTKAESVKEFNAVHNAFDESASKVPSVWLRGNHDQLLQNQSSSTSSFTDDDMYDYIGKYNTASKDTGHRGEYGYIDFDAKKVRVIFVNTSDDSDDSTNHDLAKKNYMSQAQLNWFHSTLASTAIDYDVVVISHIPLYNGMFSWGRDIISTVDNYNTAQNKSGNSGNVIALINGHSHNAATSATPKGIPIITVSPITDGRYNEYATSEWASYRQWGEYNGNDPQNSDPIYRDKKPNTVENTSFNVIVIDRKNKKINAVNYGCGEDRELIYDDGDNGYQPNGALNGYVQDSNGWRYYQNGKIAKGFYKVDGEYRYFDYETGYAPAIGVATINGVKYTITDEKGKYLPAWHKVSGKGTRYYYSDKFYAGGFYEIDGSKYYFDNNGYILTGKCVINQNNAYEFDSTGKYIGKVKGAFLDSLTNIPYFAEDGVLVKNKFCYDGKYYYYASSSYSLYTTPHTLTSEQTYGIFPTGEYDFDSNGRMLYLNGPYPDKYNSELLVFYINGKRIYEEGLYEYDGDYYYVRNNGLLLTWSMKITKMGTTGMPAGEYQFGEDGKMKKLNGPVKDAYSPNYWNFYKDGIRVYDEGLYEYNGKYYYVRSNGLLLTWGMRINKMGTTGLPAGEYLFNDMGELQLLNGPVKDTYSPNYWNFYKDGIRIYDEGLYEYNGKYYYVRSNGLLLTWGMRINKMGTTGLPAGEYLFNDMGELQLLNGPVKDTYSPNYWNFYKDGIRIYDEGLYEYNGKYYYVRSNGLLLTWGMKISKMGTTGLPAGEYLFNDMGELQLLNGPVKDAYSPNYWNFYIDGIRIYKEGLYEYNNTYYYVRSNGLLLTWGMYINKMGDTGMPAGEYSFNEKGEMQLTTGPVQDAYNPAYYTFYINGVRIYEEGLYEYNGDYYYVRNNGLLLTWGQYINKMGTTGLPAGNYNFGTDGKMIK